MHILTTDMSLMWKRKDVYYTITWELLYALSNELFIFDPFRRSRSRSCIFRMQISCSKYLNICIRTAQLTWLTLADFLQLAWDSPLMVVLIKNVSLHNFFCLFSIHSLRKLTSRCVPTQPTDPIRPQETNSDCLLFSDPCLPQAEIAPVTQSFRYRCITLVWC